MSGIIYPGFFGIKVTRQAGLARERAIWYDFAMKQLFFGLVFIAAICAQGATLDALAAKVGNQVLTVSDVINEMRRTSKGVDAPNFPVAYSNAVQSLIDRKLILKAAADKKMDMQEWMVDNRVREIVKDVFEGDKNKLNAALAESKIPITECATRSART